MHSDRRSFLARLVMLVMASLLVLWGFSGQGEASHIHSTRAERSLEQLIGSDGLILAGIAQGGTAVKTFTAGMLYSSGGTTALTTVVCATAGTVLVGGAPPTCSATPTVTSITTGVGSVTAPAVNIGGVLSNNTGFYSPSSNNIFLGNSAIGDLIEFNGALGFTRLFGNIGLGTGTFGASATLVWAQVVGTCGTTRVAGQTEQCTKNWNGANTAALFLSGEETAAQYIFGSHFVMGAGEQTATLSALTFRGPNATGTNVAGVATTLQASLGTGTGNAGTLPFAVALAKQTTGTTAHTASTVMTLGNTQSAHPGTVGFAINYPAVTVTDENTAASGTAVNAVAYAFQQPTFAARNTSVTNTVASSVYIANEPAAGTNVTIGTGYALNVAAGRSIFAGKIYASGLTSSATGDYVCFNTSTNEITQNASTCTLSSERYKTAIVPLGRSMDVLMALRPIQYEYRHRRGNTRFGLSAEQVARVEPRLVQWRDGYPEAVVYNDVVPLLIRGVQELQERLVALEQR